MIILNVLLLCKAQSVFVLSIEIVTKQMIEQFDTVN